MNTRFRAVRACLLAASVFAGGCESPVGGGADEGESVAIATVAKECERREGNVSAFTVPHSARFVSWWPSRRPHKRTASCHEQFLELQARGASQHPPPVMFEPTLLASGTEHELVPPPCTFFTLMLLNVGVPRELDPATVADP
jgi:hypothetical protein